MESPNAPSVSASAWASNSFTTPSCQRPAANPGGPLAVPGRCPRRHRIVNRHPRQTPRQPSCRKPPDKPRFNLQSSAARQTLYYSVHQLLCHPYRHRRSPLGATTTLSDRRGGTDSGQNFDLIDAISSRSVKYRVRTLTSPPIVECADPPNPSSPNIAPDP